MIAKQFLLGDARPLRGLRQRQGLAGAARDDRGQPRQVIAVLDEVVGRRAEADEILEQLELARRMRLGGVIHAQGLEAVCRQAVHGRQDATAAGILPAMTSAAAIGEPFPNRSRPVRDIARP